jgi:hypothetical protein
MLLVNEAATQLSLPRFGQSPAVSKCPEPRNRQADHYDGGKPGNNVEDGRVHEFSHQLFLVDEQEHEYQNEG